MIVALLFLLIAAAAYAGLTGADPAWVIGTLLTVAPVTWSLAAGIDYLRRRKRPARERPRTCSLRDLAAWVAVWWLAYRLSRLAAAPVDVPPRPQARPDRPLATSWGRSAPTRHRRHR